MTKLTKEEFIKSLNEMTILEVKELVDAMKEAYGIDPTAMATVAAPQQEAGEAEGPKKVNLELLSAGVNKIQVIKLVRDITGLGLKEAKDIADKGGTIKEGILQEEANELKIKLEEAGASVEIK